jgi:hypothetical protein
MQPLKRITTAMARRGLIRWPPVPAKNSQRSKPTLSAMAERQPPDQQASIEYLRGVGADLRYWYQSAEAKAQLALTVNGIFLTFLTTSVLARGSAVAQETAAFGVETWIFLAGMSSCLALAILSITG